MERSSTKCAWRLLCAEVCSAAGIPFSSPPRQTPLSRRRDKGVWRGGDENGMPAAEHTSAHSNRQAHLVELRSICYCRSAMAATHPANAHPDAPRPRNKRQRAINGNDKKSLVLHCSNLWIIAVNRCGTATTAPSLTRRWSGKIRTVAQTRVAPHP